MYGDFLLHTTGPCDKSDLRQLALRTRRQIDIRMCSTTTQSRVVFLHVREPDMATRKGLFVASPDDRPTRAVAVDNAQMDAWKR